MTTTTQKTCPYEGLFLFPQQQLSDMRGAVEHIQDILTRADAQVISLRKWEERRLAYEIKGNKRGLYFLVYFTATPTALTEIERACNLSEHLLRTMITRADHIPPDELTAADGRVELEDEIKARETEATSGSSDDKPAADKPAADKPAADKPTADKPTADKPAADKPAADKPTADKPTADKPAADKPVADKPAVDKPAVEVSVETVRPEAGAAAETEPA